MEKAAASQSTPLTLHDDASMLNSLLPGEHAVPVVDLKSPLKSDKIEQTETEPDEAPPQDEPKVNYGEKVFFFGMIFCVFIVVTVLAISYFLLQNTTQSQKVISFEQTTK